MKPWEEEIFRKNESVILGDKVVVLVGDRDIHLQFYCQDRTKHEVRGKRYVESPRLVLTVRQSLYPWHGDCFAEVLAAHNVTEERHDNYVETGVWSTVSRGSRAAVAGSAEAGDEEKEEESQGTDEAGTSGSKNKKKPSRDMQLGSFKGEKDPGLEKCFEAEYWLAERVLWKHMVQSCVLRRMMEKDGVFVELMDLTASSRKDYNKALQKKSGDKRSLDEMELEYVTFEYGVSPKIKCYVHDGNNWELRDMGRLT